jgi:hypothetical protein
MKSTTELSDALGESATSVSTKRIQTEQILEKSP